MTLPNRLATRLTEISFLLFVVIVGAVFSVCSAQSLWIHHPTQAIKWYRLNDTGTLMVSLTPHSINSIPKTGRPHIQLEEQQGTRGICNQIEIGYACASIGQDR